ncbi:imelysin family protein [Teredinibacter haidensis]|uniref:imelysin family protein n=1 Tax=Teredinibacter haidensis TaxID=2731755 RepID=UPI000B210F44|nr:imelysin family protein [Teredinibacter haidensis]
MASRLLAIIALSVLSFSFAGCESKKETTDKTAADIAPNAQSELSPQAAIEATNILWLAGTKALNSSLKAGLELNQKIETLLLNPTQENLLNAQQSWKPAELAYRQFFFHSQLGIAAPEIFTPLTKACFSLAAHPIQPGYLDYFGAYQYSGLVHDISVQLSAENLMHSHGMTDPEDVALGLYAIEYMLFGENHTRPISDYEVALTLNQHQKQTGYKTVEETPNNRRRHLLQLQSDILKADIQQLADLWQASNSGSLKAQWTDLTANTKRKTVRKTFERALTQLILQITTLAPQEDAEPASTEDIQRLAADIHSLTVIGPWLTEAQRNDVSQQLQRAETLLQQLVTESENKVLWQQTYQATKAAMDACRRKIDVFSVDRPEQG